MKYTWFEYQITPSHQITNPWKQCSIHYFSFLKSDATIFHWFLRNPCILLSRALFRVRNPWPPNFEKLNKNGPYRNIIKQENFANHIRYFDWRDKVWWNEIYKTLHENGDRRILRNTMLQYKKPITPDCPPGHPIAFYRLRQLLIHLKSKS